MKDRWTGGRQKRKVRNSRMVREANVKYETTRKREKNVYFRTPVS